jgi:hypothetical protein
VTLDKDGNVVITGKDIPEDAQVQVTDKVGNTDKSPVTDVTPELGKPTIEISTDGNDDAYLSGTELGSSETVNTVVGLPEGTKAGDIVKVKDQTGKEYPHTVTVDEATAGKSTVAVDRPAEGSELKVTATVTNGAGTSPSSDADSAVVDTTTSAGEPELVKGVDGTDTITTKVDPKDVISKDDIKLVDKDGNKIDTTVTLDKDGNVVITGKDIPEDAQVQVTDKVGNTDKSPVTDVTPELGKPTIEISTDGNNDAYLSGTELGSSETVNTVVGLPEGTKAGDIVTVKDQTGKEYPHTVTVDEATAGKSTVAVDRPAEGSELKVTATVTNGAGTSPSSDADSAVVDTTTSAGEPELVKGVDGTDTITTKVDPEDVISKDDIKLVDKDGNKIDTTVTLGDDGTVTITGKDIPEDAQVQVTDKVGNTAEATPENKTPAPTVAVTGYYDNFAGGIKDDNVPNTGLTNDNTPALSGTVKNGKTVEVFIDGISVGTATVNSDGLTWSLPELTEGLADGLHTITAKVTGADGQTATSNEYAVTVDTVVKIQDKTPDDHGPEFVLNSDDTITVIAKVTTSDPGSTVQILDSDDKVIGEGVVDETGQILIKNIDISGVSNLEDLTIKVTDKAGNTDTADLQEANPPIPVITIEDGGDDYLNNDEIKEPVLVNITVPTNSSNENNNIQNGDKIIVKLPEGIVPVESPDYSYDPATQTITFEGKKDQGTYTFEIDPDQSEYINGTDLQLSSHVERDVDGITATSQSTIDTTKIDTVVDAGEPELVKGVDGNDTITTKVDPKDVISKDDIKLVDKDGNEIPDTEVTLGDDGTVTITGEDIPLDAKVVVTDKVGNTTEVTPENKTPAPKVAVTGYFDDVAGGINNANVADKGLTNDNKPVLSGTVENGKTVEVFIDGASVGIATVNSDGTWSLPELATALTDGTHTITAKVTGADGQTATSNEYAVTVDTTVSAGEPELVKGVDGTDTITTKVDPEDVISKDDIKLVDKDGNEIPDTEVTLGDDGTVTITGEDIPLDAKVQVTDKAGNTDSQPLSYLASDDFNEMAEDSGTISGTVLTNDKLGSIVTGFMINGTSYNAGQEATIADVGKVTIAADGKYSFTPVTDYSGDVPAITYTVSNDSKVDSANLKIKVVAVADQPSTGTFELDPPKLSLNMQTWTNVKIINGHNLLKNGGDGASNEDLIAAIDYLRSHESVKNDGNNTDVIYDEPTTTTSLEANTLATYKAVYISGYVFLEAGQTYLYSGTADDSATIVIGDGVSSLHVNWKGTSTSGNGEFSVTETGYYTFQFYAHNAENIGNYHFSVNNADGSDMKYYPDLSAIEASLQGSTYLLGDYNAGEDGKSDTGFYPVSMGYSGASSHNIALTGINPKVTDTDGSEYLSFVIDGLPEGAILSFNDANGDPQSVKIDSSGKASWSPVATDQGTSEYTDFVLNLDGANQDSNLNVTLTVTSTEKSNGDKASSTLQFEVEVTDGLNKTVIAKAGDDTISTGSTGHDTVIYNVLDAADAKAGHGTDTWTDFGLGNTDDTSSGYDSNADTIKFSADFFDGLLADKSNISEYINVNTTGTTTTISVDRDGADNGTNYLDLLVLTNQTTDVTLQTLLDNHQIIIG